MIQQQQEFEVLENIAKGEYCDNQELLTALQKGRRYLETRYQSNCSDNSTIASHNYLFPLSDPKESLMKFMKLQINYVLL